MDQATGGPGGEGVALYRCPYCKKLFTKLEGWDTAVLHIKQKHMKEENHGRATRRNAGRRAAPRSLDHEGLFDGEETEGELA